MSDNNTFVQVNYLPQQVVNYSVLGYGSVGFALAGTFSSGVLKLQGSNDGNTWTDLQVTNGGVLVEDNEITTTGNYVASTVSYQQLKLLPVGFTGTLTVTASISTRIT